MQAIRSALGARVRPAALLLAAAAIVLGMLAASADASAAYSAASAQPRPIPWTGWKGRPIQRPHKPVSPGQLTRASLPKGWSAGAVRYGTGYHRLGGSQRVREVQRRLTRLGYNTGPIDGLYGPLTRSSVQWFQIKHGLRPTGVVAATTLAALRDPKSFAQTPGARAKQPKAPAGRPQVPQPEPRAPEQVPAKPASNDTTADWLLPLLLAALAALVALALLSLRTASRKSRGGGSAVRPGPAVPAVPAEPAPSNGPASAPSNGLAPAPSNGPQPLVLGYVSGDDGRAIEPHEVAIRAACQQYGWVLKRLVREGRPRDRVLSRPGLAYVFEQLSNGGASRLVVHRLEHLARSMSELRAVLGWFLRTGVALTALDVHLDTGTPEGRTAAQTLLSEVGSREAQLRTGANRKLKIERQ